MIVSKPEAIQLLQQNEVVALPSETVYGLAGRIESETALKKIFSTKERPFFDPLIIHVSHEDQISPLTHSVTRAHKQLMSDFWPGPLTLIFKKSNKVSPLITADKTTVALRCPDHSHFRDIISVTGPLAAPSANPFGKVSPSQAQHVVTAFGGRVPVLDGGSCEVGLESTIAEIQESEEEISISILRPGQITQKDIKVSLSRLGKPLKIKNTSTTVAPGTLKNHYQPEVPLVLLRDSVAWSDQHHQELCQNLKIPLTTPAHFWRFQESEPALVARTLYQELRNNAPPNHYTVLQMPTGKAFLEGDAIYDRLQKACSAFLLSNDSPLHFKN